MCRSSRCSAITTSRAGKPTRSGRSCVEAGITVLDGEACEVHGIGIAGVKGFGGGFGQRALGAWGEDSIKHFVREAVDEALKLETALARLRTLPSVALLHYSPMQQTVEGEPLEIYPFLGSSRLEEPINTLSACPSSSTATRTCGRAEGTTSTGVPVYNVSMPLLARSSAMRRRSGCSRFQAAEPSAVGAGVERRGRRQAPIAVSVRMRPPEEPDGNFHSPLHGRSGRDVLSWHPVEAGGRAFPFLVGGALAFSHYSNVPRDTKDIDVFVKRGDCPRVLEAFARAGLSRPRCPFPHWLGKVRQRPAFHGRDLQLWQRHRARRRSLVRARAEGRRARRDRAPSRRWKR